MSEKSSDIKPTEWHEYLIDTFCESIMAFAIHPLAYSKTMMMIGYEPLPATMVSPTFSFLCPKKQYLMLPNAFSYTRAIRNDIGLVNLWTVGFPATLTIKLMNSYLLDRSMEVLQGDYVSRKSYLQCEGGAKSALIQTTKLCTARVAGVCVTYPIYVIMVRQMAEAIKLHGVSTTVFTHLTSIIREEGIMALYSGLPSRISEEVLTVFTISMFSYFLNQKIFPPDSDNSSKSLTPVAVAFIITSFAHPFAVVAATMTVAGSKFSLSGSAYPSSLQCFLKLNQTGQLNRGLNLFYRYLTNGVV